MRDTEYTSMINSTILFLIFPVISISGLINITRVIFRESRDASSSDRQIDMTNNQLNTAKVSVVLLWLIVILLIILWIGKATQLYCFP
jgi:hypothetical protein